MAEGARVLVVEDEALVSEVLCEQLRQQQHMAVAAATVAEGIEFLKQLEFDVALLDLNLPDGSGIDVLRFLSEENLPTEAVILTGHAALSSAIEAMKLGAYDYLTKGVSMDEIDVLVMKAAEKARLRRENVSLRIRLQQQDDSVGIITEDPTMQELLATVERVAPSDLPVLIQGESGTGKELFAHAVHRRGPRAVHPFVAVNCAAVPENLLESELFGHEKGAFTGAVVRKPGLFEVADRGVLFLDEVGEIPAPIQVKLLRAIETKEFFRVGGIRSIRADVRIVSATNKRLKSEMQAGRFREDLYYRLNGVTLALPPLRERPADIPLLAAHFLARAAPRKRLSAPASEALRLYQWPGNVRELQMVIQRAAILCPRETIDLSDLPIEAPDTPWTVAATRTGMTLAEMERQYIESVLRAHDGHRGKAATALGIDPKTLYNKLGPERPRRSRD
jgi:two-component system, NtrC family, response regulator AtoC